MGSMSLAQEAQNATAYLAAIVPRKISKPSSPLCLLTLLRKPYLN
jgi:hypothetical protein